MNFLRTLVCISFVAIPVVAQPQIGGGTCDSSALNGNYSLTLSGRDVSSAVAFSNIVQGVGTATFDGLSKVTFTLTNNSNKGLGVAQVLSGTYSLQSNCIGVVNITSGDTASFTLGAYNQGIDFFIDGQDGTYSLIGSGSVLPASCNATLLNGTYSFNGNGFALNATAIAGVNYISGLITFDGTSNITTSWYVAASGTSTPDTTSGTYTVATGGCTATATVTDPSGNAYNLVFTITSSRDSNFLLSGGNAKLIFVGSGRIL